MVIDVYADVVCPWCYIGERRLTEALSLRPEVEAEVRWRPFQLRPEMPEGGLPWPEFSREKFGGEDAARAAFDQVTEVGASEGLRFDFTKVASAPNTVDAHRLILFSARYGLQQETADALFRAYFSDGRNLNEEEDLVAAAAGAGLDADEVRAYLSGTDGVDEVNEAQKDAHRKGVRGVPLYVIGGRYAVSGAQPVEVFCKPSTSRTWHSYSCWTASTMLVLAAERAGSSPAKIPINSPAKMAAIAGSVG